MHNPSITSFNPLQPVVIRTIREVFDVAVNELEMRQGHASLPTAARSKLARRIVDLARHGERDFDRLRTAALGEATA
ncbi:MAG: hypothetical protein ABL973_15560 [Micropepsaceae bacterium]